MTCKSIRSGLLRRWELAEEMECQYVEVPADFAGSQRPLGKEAISGLYEKKGDVLPKGLKYIFHTEPSIARGGKPAPPLEWYDRKWMEKFVDMVISLSEFLGKPASMIEIHPGNRRQNSFQDIAKSIRFLLDKYCDALGVEPLILLENRTEQRISRGREINDFWNFICETHSDLKDKFGIVLDVQQLFTQEKHDLKTKLKLMQPEILRARFIRKLDMIPLEALKGFHIHFKHKVPHEHNEVPWKLVFDRMKQIRKHIIINPEVLNEKWVEPTINFCKDLLSK